MAGSLPHEGGGDRDPFATAFAQMAEGASKTAEAMVRWEAAASAFREAFEQAFGGPMRLARRMVAAGWSEDDAVEYALSLPADVCWLYPVPVPKEAL